MVLLPTVSKEDPKFHLINEPEYLNCALLSFWKVQFAIREAEKRWSEGDAAKRQPDLFRFTGRRLHHDREHRQAIFGKHVWKGDLAFCRLRNRQGWPPTSVATRYFRLTTRPPAIELRSQASSSGPDERDNVHKPVDEVSNHGRAFLFLDSHTHPHKA